MCNPEPLKKQPKQSSNFAASSWKTGVVLRWDSNCIPHSKLINWRNTWVNLEKTSLSRGLAVFEEKTQMYQKKTSVSDSVTTPPPPRTWGAMALVVQAKLFGPCDACEALVSQEGPLGLGPGGKPPSRVSGDWSVREWGHGGKAQGEQNEVTEEWTAEWKNVRLGSCGVRLVGTMEWHTCADDGYGSVIWGKKPSRLWVNWDGLCSYNYGITWEGSRSDT